MLESVESEGHLSSFTASSTFSNLILTFADLVFFQAPGEKWPCALTDIQVTQDTADAGHMDIEHCDTGTGDTLTGHS